MVTLKKKCCCGGGDCPCPCATSKKFSYAITPITYDTDGCRCDTKPDFDEPYASDTDGSMYGCMVWNSGCTWRVAAASGGLWGAYIDPYNCGWTYTPVPSIGLTLNTIIEGGCRAYLTIAFQSGTVIYYTDTFDCDGPNTLTLSVDDTPDALLGGCQLPTTITVDTIDRCGPCDGCTDDILSITFSISGTGGGGDCGDFDGDYCLCPYFNTCAWVGFNANGKEADLYYVGPYASSSSLGGNVPFHTTGYYLLHVWGLGKFYALAADFDCSGDTVFTLFDSESVVFGVDCTAPSTITVTASTVDECAGGCDTPPPPPEGCLCTPKSDYSPRVVIDGISADTCADCACFPALDLCFEPYGADDTDCMWTAEITLPATVAAACETSASYALLNMSEAGQTVVIYDASDNPLATFRAVGTDCDTTAKSFAFDSQAPDETCDWSGATCTLDMHGAACDVCVCDPGLWLVSIEYAANGYTWCVAVNECSGNSGIYEIFSGGGAGLSVTVELGELPASYARVLVYYYPDATVPGTRTLIGVYNYPYAMSSFTCSTSSSNTMLLATGNAGECGAGIDETQTADLEPDAYLSATTSSAACPTCDGDPMPPTLTATFANNSGNCCDDALSTTLVWDSVNQWWYGEITGCSSGETIQITLEQTGTTCSGFRMTVVYVNSCDPGVSDVAPESGCSCGSLTFNVTGDVGTISDDFITVTW